MKQVCVLGNGQLGRMLRQAGEPLGIAVWPVGLEADPEAVPFQQSVITAEIERWPETALTRELARHPAFVNRDVFPIIADRLTQKQLFDKLGLATAPWQLLADKSEWPAVFARLGELAIVKRRVGGYDGRGQWRLRENEIDQLPADNYGECIVEQGINFSGEVSLVGARAHDGSTVFYPLTRNLHQDGILRASVAFPQANARQQEQAESQLPVDSLFRKIETFEPGVYAQYEEDDIHYLINNLRNTYERNSWDKRYKLFMHIADFYAMWLSDRKQLWSIGQNISLFKANLEECEIGLQKKEEDLRSGTKNK